MTFRQHSYPLQVEPTASKSLMSIVGFLHLASYASVALANPPIEVLVPACGIIALSFVYAVKRCRRRVSINWDSEGDWQVSFEGQERVSARLCGTSIVNRNFVWLHLRSEKRRLISLILPRDCLSAQCFRRLRVRLLIDGTGEEKKDIFKDF